MNILQNYTRVKVFTCASLLLLITLGNRLINNETSTAFSPKNVQFFVDLDFTNVGATISCLSTYLHGITALEGSLSTSKSFLYLVEF